MERPVDTFCFINKKMHTINVQSYEGVIIASNEPSLIGRNIAGVEIKGYEKHEIK